MPIAAVDWQIFAAFLLFLVLFVASLEEVSAFLQILAGFVVLILAALLDASVFATASGFVRYGVFVVLVVLGVMLMVRGTLGFPKEVSG